MFSVHQNNRNALNFLPVLICFTINLTFLFGNFSLFNSQKYSVEHKLALNYLLRWNTGEANKKCAEAATIQSMYYQEATTTNI